MIDKKHDVLLVSEPEKLVLNFHTLHFFLSLSLSLTHKQIQMSASSSFRYKKVDMNYARVAAALVVLLPSSAFLARLYKDMNAECAFFILEFTFSFLTANTSFFLLLQPRAETRWKKPTDGTENSKSQRNK